MDKKSNSPSNTQQGPPSDVEVATVSKEPERQQISLKQKCFVLILGSVIIILWLIAAYIFLVHSSHEKNAPIKGPTNNNIFNQTTRSPTTHSTPFANITAPDHSISPTTASPTQSPTDLESSIREFLLNHTTTTTARRSAHNPAAAKAIDWLVEEASQSRGTLDPFNQKFLQRYGILILYFSVDRNANRLPNRRMRNRDECSWPGMTCGRNGMLKRIKLVNRQLDGTLPAEWGFFPNLKSIDLIRNNLKGSIPEELFDVLGIEQVFLYRNQLTGTISSKIGQLWKLTHFHVADNRLSGFIPSEMASTRQMRKVRHFNVHNNRMSGVVPPNMNLNRLYYMDLGHNRFSGTLPPDLGTFERLQFLFLDHNNFLGTVPESYVTAGNGKISALYLNDNKLSGKFPGTGKLFHRMQELKVENNNFDPCTRGLYPFEEPTILDSTCAICECRGLFMCRFCNDHPY